MKPENQVCTHEQAIDLRVMGIAQNGYFTWQNLELGIMDDEAESEDQDKDFYDTREHWALSTLSTEHEFEVVSDLPEWWDQEDYTVKESVSAFTVAELGVMLADYVDEMQFNKMKNIWNNKMFVMTSRYDEAKARADLLLLLLEKGIITPEQINKRLTES